jgi:choline-sulfatase
VTSAWTSGAKRILLATAGGCVGAAAVALIEARAAERAGSGAHPPPFMALAMADLAVLAPLGVVMGALLGALSIYLHPDRPHTIGEQLAQLRAQPVLERSRTAAVAPLAILATFAWCATMAHVGKSVLAHGAPQAAGVELATCAIAVLGMYAACAFALLTPLRRVLAAGAAKTPRLVDPVTTAGAGLAIAAAALAAGIALGDNGGNGRTPLAIFGVLQRNELDLRPVANLVAIALFAWLSCTLSAVGTLRGTKRRFDTVLALAVVAGGLLLTVREARALDDRADVARSIERNASLGKVALGLARKVTDRDHDGYSPYFAGGDCQDRDPRISPASIDVPGNGIDEDCSGADSPLPTKVVTASNAADASADTDAAAPPAKTSIDKDYNLVLITIDTLRTNVGFMGYPKPTTPNLDKLAAKGVVFDHAYAMASYTGKSLAPLLIGKYPSETERDGSHFNRYSDKNVTVTERLKKAGVRTFGAASHWYFKPSFGLPQGMDDWDTSAIPGEGQGESDTSITSPQLTDAAIKLLGKSENTAGRFFMWVHYFDPHAEFMPHKDAPPELKPDDQKSAGWGLRWMYDGEIWFTDKHVGRLLDYIAAQPWGENTIIVVTADHGEMIVEHNMTYHGFELWEQLVHVPLLVYVPGDGFQHGVHVTPKRSHIDVVPTILELMKQPLPGPLEISGESMLDCIAARAPAAPSSVCPERDVYIDMPPGPNTGMRHALLSGPAPGMKLIHLQGNQYQLFDLASDPLEADDLSRDKARLAEMVAKLQAKKAELREIYVKPEEPGH